MKTLRWLGAAVVATAWLAHGDVLLPQVLEPATSVVGRAGASAPTSAPERLPLAAPVVPRAELGQARPTGAQPAAVPDLDLLSESAYQELTAPPMRTTALWRVMGFGLWRGFANLTLWPGELVRGFTYEFSSQRPWYEALGTSWLAGLGGGMSRMSAGVADIVTLGYFGDIRLARGYPDFVWQGDWFYHETLQPPTLHTSDEPVGPATPRKIVQPGTAPVTVGTTDARVRSAPSLAPPPPAASVADPTLPGGTPRPPR
ncbi:MAG: hypothetical protein N2595_06210 [bacterium]|nr:hypothetical protein [bacterium]